MGTPVASDISLVVYEAEVEYQALVEYSSHRYDEAAKSINRCRPHDRWHRAFLAACCAQMGRMDEAHIEIAAFIEVRRRELEERGEQMPVDTIELASFRANRYRQQADRDHFLDGLRRAGLTG